jgi:hypothetical protein
VFKKKGEIAYEEYQRERWKHHVVQVMHDTPKKSSGGLDSLHVSVALRQIMLLVAMSDEEPKMTKKKIMKQDKITGGKFSQLRWFAKFDNFLTHFEYERRPLHLLNAFLSSNAFKQLLGDDFKFNQTSTTTTTTTTNNNSSNNNITDNSTTKNIAHPKKTDKCIKEKKIMSLTSASLEGTVVGKGNSVHDAAKSLLTNLRNFFLKKIGTPLFYFVLLYLRTHVSS